jgi:hypothetical protein
MAMPASTGAARRGDAAPPEQSRIHVLAYLDATDSTLEASTVQRLKDLERARSDAPGSLTGAANVHRAGASKTWNRVIAAAALAVPMAAAGSLALLGGPVIGLAAGLPLFGTGALVALKRLAGELRKGHDLEPAWKGRRLYEVAADDGPTIASQARVQSTNRKADTVEQLRAYLEKYSRPCDTSVFFVAGHGKGYTMMADNTVSDVARAFERHPQDLMILESCLMGNLESLTLLGDSAKVILASEKPITAGALPLRAMLADAVARGGTPQEMAARMMHKVQGHNEQSARLREQACEGSPLEALRQRVQSPPIETYAAFDMAAVKRLNARLDELGGRLLKESAGPEGTAAIKLAISGARKIEGSDDLRDLGDFLVAVSQGEFAEETRGAARQALAHLDACTLGRVVEASDRPLSGLSFRARLPARHDLYDEVPMGSDWKKLIERMS